MYTEPRKQAVAAAVVTLTPVREVSGVDLSEMAKAAEAMNFEDAALSSMPCPLLPKVCTYVCIYIYMYIFIYKYIYICVCVCVCIHIYIAAAATSLETCALSYMPCPLFPQGCNHICIYIYTYICWCGCAYIHIYEVHRSDRDGQGCRSDEL